MKHRLNSFLLAAMIVLLIPVQVFAHGGRTDSSGGHNDSKNASGLGSYHYHCGGNPAHLHNEGVCKYNKTPASQTPIPKSSADPLSVTVKNIISHESKPGWLSIHFIDVGQGDSIFFNLPNEETMLIDAGPGNGQRVINYLTSQNIEKIDYLIATHPHEDHIGGMAAVIKSFCIGELYMPDVVHTTKTFENLLLEIEEKDLMITVATAGIEIKKNETFSVYFIAPNNTTYSNMNNYSAVIRIEFGDTAFLFTGDAESISEEEMLNNGVDINADVLKIGHHGSNTSTSKKFLNAVKPTYAVISIGKNSYGHPADVILERLEKAEIKVFRTDVSGTVVLTSDGDVIDIFITK